MLKNIVLCLLFLTIGTSLLRSQIAESALVFNPQLGERLTKARSSHERAFQVFVLVGSSTQYCAEESLIDGPLNQVEFRMCNTLNFGAINPIDSCLEYVSNGTPGTDIVCMTICDTLENCDEFEIHFISKEAIDLPFVEDFSYSSPMPDPTLWLDQDVYVNSSLAERLLSVGVATFDGLDDGGSPYSGPAGYSDQLTSTFIDLSSSANAWISFYLQPKGFGLKPRIQDSISLDLRAVDGRWIRVWQLEGLPSSFSSRDPAPDFAFYSLEIPDSLKHEGFQFRFRNKSKNEGLQELWHLDYVRVSDQVPPSTNIEDIAFVRRPASALKKYSAMPWRQFAGSEVKEIGTRLKIELYNHFDEVETANPSRLLMDEDVTLTPLITNLTLLEVPPISNENQRNLAPGRHQFENALDPGRFINNLITLQPAEEKFLLRTTYEFEQDQESNNGIDALLRNNVVSSTTVLSDYYAYDDGTAESAIIDRGSTQTTKLAVEFEANIADSLKGIQILIPHIEGDITTQRFRIMVWIDSLSEEPFFQQDQVRPYYADAFFDTLQGFTTYDLRDSNDAKISIPIPEGKFYIGWEQSDLGSNLRIPIGYDLNTPDGSNFFYFNDGSGWVNVGDTTLIRKGSLMIRAILGEGEVISTPVYEALDQTTFRVFPNPAVDHLNIRYERLVPADWIVEISDASGRRFLRRALFPRLRVADLPAGVYYLTITNYQEKRRFSTSLFISP